MKENNNTLLGRSSVDVRNSYANLHIERSKTVAQKASDVGRVLSKSKADVPEGRQYGMCRKPRSPAKRARGSLSSSTHAPAAGNGTIRATTALDDEAERLQQELRSYDQKLQAIKSTIASVSVPPKPAPLPSSFASSKRGLIPAAMMTQVSTSSSYMPPAAQQKHNEIKAALPQQPPQKQQAAVEPEHASVVKTVITATGTGCKDVVTASAVPGQPQTSNSVWKTRPHKTAFAESSCTLQLIAKQHADVTVRITFADAMSVPAVVRFEHAAKPTTAFEPLGEVRLHARSMRQLKHMFRLGSAGFVQKCVRVTCIGHISKDNSGMHKVNFLSLTGTRCQGGAMSLTPQRTETFTLQSADPETALEMQGTAESQPVQNLVDSVEHTVIASQHHRHQLYESTAATAAPIVKKKAVPPPAPPMPRKAAAPPPPPPLPTKAPAGPQQVVPEEGVDANGAADGSRAPARPTMRLFWSKLPPGQMEDTVWGELEDMGSELDYSNLEEDFAVAQPAAPQQKTIATKLQSLLQKKKPSRPGSITILSVQRANNVGVLLAGLKLSAAQAQQTLLHLLCETDNAGSGASSSSSAPARELDEDALQSVLQCLPTAEERAQLSAFTGDLEALGDAERFMIAMLPVSHLRERLLAEMFRLEFAGRVDVVQSKAALLEQACKEVRSSALLRSLFKTALLIGNFLNSGNKNGSASGFQVDALLKLKDVKSTKARSRSLLHFLAREVSKQHPNNASLKTALPWCTTAARLDLPALRAELEELAEGLLAVEKAVSDCGNAAYVEKFEPFVSGGADTLADIQGQLIDADAAFLNLRTFINGRKGTMEEPAALFGVLDKFAVELDQAHADNAAEDRSSARNTAKAGGDGAKRPATAPASSMAGETQKLQELHETPPLRRRDRMLATIRLYSRMTAEQRKALLTEQGAAERMQKLNITHRHSVNVGPSEHATTGEVSSMAAVAGSSTKAVVPIAAKAAVRASAPAAALAAVLAKSRARRLSPAPSHPDASLATTSRQLSAVGEEDYSTGSIVSTEQQNDTMPCASTQPQESSGNTADSDDNNRAASTVAVPATADPASSSMCNLTDITLTKQKGGHDVDQPIAADSPSLGVIEEGSGESGSVAPQGAYKSRATTIADSPTVDPHIVEDQAVEQGGANKISSPVAKLIASSTRLIQSMEMAFPLGQSLAVAAVADNKKEEEGTGVEGHANVASELTPEVCASPETTLPATQVDDGDGDVNDSPAPLPFVEDHQPQQHHRVSRESNRQSRRSVHFAENDEVVPGVAPPQVRHLQRTQGQILRNSGVSRHSTESLSPASTPLVSFKTAGAGGRMRTMQGGQVLRYSQEEEEEAVLEAPPSNKRPRSAIELQGAPTRQPNFAAAPMMMPVGIAAPQVPVARHHHQQQLHQPAGWDALPVDPYFRHSQLSGLQQQSMRQSTGTYVDPTTVGQQQQQQYYGAPPSPKQQWADEPDALGMHGYHNTDNNVGVDASYHHQQHVAPQQQHQQYYEEEEEAVYDEEEYYQQQEQQPEWVPDPECPLTGDSTAAVASDSEEELANNNNNQHNVTVRNKMRGGAAPTAGLYNSLHGSAMAPPPARPPTSAPVAGVPAIMMAGGGGGARVHQSWAHPQQQQQPQQRRGGNMPVVAQSMPAGLGAQPEEAAAYDEDFAFAPIPINGSFERPSSGRSGAISGTAAASDSSAARLEALRRQATEVLTSALASDMRRSLPNLPGVPVEELPALPLPHDKTGRLKNGKPAAAAPLSPPNLDAIMAAVIANAGNTPTGPLARGVREGDEQLFDDSPANALREDMARRAPHRALLEPVLPAPLGMGVRASETVAHGISPASLRQNLSAHLRPLQPSAEELSMHSRMVSRSRQTSAVDGSYAAAGRAGVGGSVQGPHALVNAAAQQLQAHQRQQQMRASSASHAVSGPNESMGVGGAEKRAPLPAYHRQPQQQYHHHQQQQPMMQPSSRPMSQATSGATTTGQPGFKAAASRSTLRPMGTSAQARQAAQQEALLQQALAQHQQQMIQRERASLSASVNGSSNNVSYLHPQLQKVDQSHSSQQMQNQMQQQSYSQYPQQQQQQVVDDDGGEWRQSVGQNNVPWN